MGFFDKVFSQVSESTPSIQEGFIQLCIAASGADGIIDDDEFNAIVGYISRLKMFNDVSDREINKYFQKAVGTLRTKGAEELLIAGAQQIPEELKNTAFASICDIVLSDGELADAEKKILEKAYECLKVNESEATTIMEVILIKNKM